MKHIEEMEPGVLPTFRLFIGVQLVIAVLGILGHLLLPFDPPDEVIGHFRAFATLTEVIAQLTLIALESLPLFLFLSIPGPRRVLKAYYLPIGILWAAAWPILIPYIELYAGGENASGLLQSALWQQIILLFIPLIIVSWQYTIRHVILFCALTTGLNHLLLFSSFTVIETPLLRSFLGIMIVQVVAFLLVGHMIATLVKVQREQRLNLTEANQRLAQYVSAVEQLTISRERNRLAREMHDVLAHTLSGVAVELEGLRTMLGLDPERAGTLLDHSQQAIREGLTETRRALQELRAKPLEDLGLALAIQSLAESYASRSGFQLELDIDHDLGDYPIEVQQSAYRIAQEALANVVDHAQAQKVWVLLKRDHNQIRMNIRDDGGGFDPGSSASENHYGLLGMRERAGMIGGNLSVDSQVGKGTQISFSYGGGE